MARLAELMSSSATASSGPAVAWVADRIGRREQDQPLDLGWQLTKPRCVLIFDAPGQVSRVRKSEPAGEVGGAPASVELEQGQRMAVRLLQNPGADALVERT